jgi:hypothetical protein
VALSVLDGFQCIGEGADLVDFDDDGVSCAEFDALA